MPAASVTVCDRDSPTDHNQKCFQKLACVSWGDKAASILRCAAVGEAVRGKGGPHILEEVLSMEAAVVLNAKGDDQEMEAGRPYFVWM